MKADCVINGIIVTRMKKIIEKELNTFMEFIE